jgi:hypothetical protein
MYVVVAVNSNGQSIRSKAASVAIGAIPDRHAMKMDSSNFVSPEKSSGSEQ